MKKLKKKRKSSYLTETSLGCSSLDKVPDPFVGHDISRPRGNKGDGGSGIAWPALSARLDQEVLGLVLVAGLGLLASLAHQSGVTKQTTLLDKAHTGRELTQGVSCSR